MYHDMTKQHQYRLLDGIAIIRPATLTDMQSLALGPSQAPAPSADTADAQNGQEQAEEEEA